MRRNVRNSIAAGAIAMACLLGGTIVAAPASANTPTAPETIVLDNFRANLVALGRTADIATFDGMTAGQRTELSDYLLGESVSLTPPANATWSNGVATLGSFTWGSPMGVQSAPLNSQTAQASRSGSGIPIWGTQWFSFLGMKLIEVKISMTYTTEFIPNQGTKVTGIQSYSCLVTFDIDPQAELTSTKENAFPDGWEGEAQCKVSVKRGIWTPAGVWTLSTKEALHYIRGDNMGNVVAHGWK